MTNATVGVIVGRFQVARLHQGHRHRIDTARKAHEKLLIVVGSASFPTPRNPLTYPMIHAMLSREYPAAAICKIEDHPSDRIWSQALDACIDTLLPDHYAELYGSRDSFIPAIAVQTL